MIATDRICFARTIRLVLLFACIASPGWAQTPAPSSTTAPAPAATTPAPAATATPPATPAPNPADTAVAKPKVPQDCVGDDKFRTSKGLFQYPVGAPIVSTAFFLPAGTTTDLIWKLPYDKDATY